MFYNGYPELAETSEIVRSARWRSQDRSPECECWFVQITANTTLVD
jgi:hypothetical protein